MRIKAAICIILMALLASSADSRSLFTAHGIGTPPPPVVQQMAFLAYPPFYGQNLTYQTTGGTGSAGRQIARIVPTMWPPNPPYAGTDFVLSGPDAGLFQLTSTGMLSVGGSDINTPGTYNVTVSANGQSQALQITIQPSGSQWLEVDKWDVVPGDVITVTGHNMPIAGVGQTQQIGVGYAQRNAYLSVPSQTVTTATASASFTMPDDGADEIKYVSANTFLTSVGGINSPPINLRPSQPIASVPTAPNTLSAPFTPTTVITACQSGCMFTDWAAAVESALDLDNVKVEIGPGVYTTCAATTHNHEQRLPKHLWLQGYGGSFPVLGWSNCQSKAALVWGEGYVYATDHPLLVVDNLRFTNVICDNQGGVRPDGDGDVWLRNVIITQTCMGTISGDFINNITISNSRFSRDGGTSGPSHNIYIGHGAGVSTLTVNDTISEQANNGYELKTRSEIIILNCNILRGDIDPYNFHSSDMHFAGGGESHLTNNLFYEGSAVVSASTDYFMLWGGGDVQTPYFTNNFIDAHDNYFVEDFPGRSGARNFWNINSSLPPVGPSPPYSFGPNSYMFTAPWSGTPSLAQFGASPTNLLFPSPSDTIFDNRVSAGMPNVTYPIPPGCSGHTIGNVSVPVLPSVP
jgi:Rieske Fe-S protein